MVATGWYMLVFRIFHILAGVAWGGSVYLFVVFIQPTSAKLGPAAAPFMRELLGGRRVVRALIVLGSITVAAGLLLYFRDVDVYEAGSFGDFVGSRFGLVLTIGAVAAIIALLVGIFGTRPGVNRLLALGAQAAQSEGPPPAEIGQQIQALQGKLKLYARTSLGFLAIAVLAMATARYW